MSLEKAAYITVSRPLCSNKKSSETVNMGFSQRQKRIMRFPFGVSTNKLGAYRRGTHLRRIRKAVVRRIPAPAAIKSVWNSD